jgi:hypothetical protein
MKKIIYIIALLLVSAITINAQDFKIPEPSSKQSIIQDFGLGKITLTYSRPNVKGRKIFGEVEPYQLVWRTGANYATTLQLTDEVTIEGNKVPAGTYALFSIPDKNEWIIILNKTAVQWGAYTYKEQDDLLRFKVKPVKMSQLTETLTMQFDEVNINTGVLHIRWEHTDLPIHFETDVDKQVMAGIDAAMNGEKKPYYRAAIYYYNHDKDIAKAFEWIDTYDKATPNSYNIKYWKARIQLKRGDKAGAIATAKEGYALAEKQKSAEYMRLNNEVILEAGKG